jgi:PKD repeat protein
MDCIISGNNALLVDFNRRLAYSRINRRMFVFIAGRAHTGSAYPVENSASNRPIAETLFMKKHLIFLWLKRRLRIAAILLLAFAAGIAPAASTNDVTVTFDSTNHLYLRLWVPDGVSKIRGVIVTTHPSGNPGYTQDYRPSADYTTAWDETYTTDYDTRTKAADLALQLVAQRHAFALVGLCFQDQKPGGITATTSSVANVSMMPAHAAALEAGMNLFAAQFNRPELTNAPIATYGFSGGSGFTAYYAAYNPGRCIAFAHNKGGSIGDYDPVFMEAAEQVPAMLCYGEIDTTDRIDTINTVFTYHRAKGAPWALIPDYGLDHDSQGYGRFLGAAFLDRVIEMRLPRDWMPGGAAPVLRPLAEDSGWLGDNTTWESNSSTIVSFTASAAALSEKRTMSWLPDRYLAEAWRSVTTHLPPVKLSSPVSALATTRPKQLAYLLAGAGQSMALNAATGSVSSVDWKNGDVLVRTESSAPFSTILSTVTGGIHLIHGELQMTNGSSRPSDLAVLLVKPPANQMPTILSGPAVSGAPTSGVPVACSVRAVDPDGSIEELLAYTWSATGPSAVSFGSGNGSNAGKDIAATFPVDGFYVLKVVVTDANAAAVTSSVDVAVGDVSTPSAGFSVSPGSGWVPLTVSFTDTSFGVITNRYWTFGDGAITNTTATNVTHTYIAGGTNTVQLIVSGPDGISTNTQVAAVTVMVPVAPFAGFSATPTSGSAPLAVTFTDTSIGTITNRFWNFGDGGTTNTTATSVSHTYTVAGTNTVQLIVSGPAGSSTNTQIDKISVAAAAQPALLIDLSGNYNTSSGNISFTKPTETTAGEARIYDNDFSAPLIAKGAAGTGGSYVGPSIYGAFRQSVAGGPPVTFTTFRMGGDSLAITPSSTLINSGVLDILYVFKKADFANGLNTGSIGFGTSSGFSVTTGTYNASTKCLRAVVQNGSTWYISVASNTVSSGTTNPKIIMTNASAALWSIWDPLTSIDTSSQDFSVTVAGSTFNDIQAVGIYDQCKSSAAFLINFNSIQIGGVAVSSGGTSYTLTGSAGANGTVSPASTNVSSGGSATFVITASNYYRIASLTTNGTPVGMSFDNDSTSTNFTWNNVQATGALVATFTNQVSADPAGTPYSWLAQYGLTNFATDAFADQDMDGLSAWQEYIAGTGPTNSQSNLSLSLQQTASQKMLQWASVSGRVYSVYWTTNLLNSFQPLETNIVWPQNSWTHAMHEAQAGGFYRIKVQLGQ